MLGNMPMLTDARRGEFLNRGESPVSCELLAAPHQRPDGRAR
jgi:hypothetical protein